MGACTPQQDPRRGPRGKGSMTLQRIVLEFRDGELIARVLYARAWMVLTLPRRRGPAKLARWPGRACWTPWRPSRAGPSAWARADSPRGRIYSAWLCPVPTSLGRPPREAFSFLCATANVCVPSSEGRVAEPMGYPIIDRGLRRGLRHDRGSLRRACREGRARDRLHRERLVGGKEDRGEEAS